MSDNDRFVLMVLLAMLVIAVLASEIGKPRSYSFCAIPIESLE